jgi:cytochrome c biogenesis protein CcdA
MPNPDTANNTHIANGRLSRSMHDLVIVLLSGVISFLNPIHMFVALPMRLTAGGVEPIPCAFAIRHSRVGNAG